MNIGGVFNKLIAEYRPSKRLFVEWRNLKGNNIYETFNNSVNYNKIQRLKKSTNDKDALKILEEAKHLRGNEQSAKLREYSNLIFEKKFHGKPIKSLDKLRLSSNTFRQAESVLKTSLVNGSVGLVLDSENILEAQKEFGNLAMTEEVLKSAVLSVLSLGAIKYSMRTGAVIGAVVGSVKPKAGFVLKDFSAAGLTLASLNGIDKYIASEWQTTLNKKRKESIFNA